MRLDIDALYTTYAEQLRGWFRRRLPRGDDGLAEELTQVVFVKVIRAADRYQDRQQPSSWLYRIATTTWLDHVEKKRPLVGLPDLDAVRVTMDAGSDAHLARLVIREALPHLAPRYRALLEARFLRGETREEVAEREGTTEQAISHRQSRALRALRGILDGSAPPMRPEAVS